MSKSKDNRDKILGMSFSTANNQLHKKILFDLSKKCKMDKCYRCNESIKKIEEFTIEHKIPWLHSEKPLELFLNFSNIAFSHAKCNRKYARGNFNSNSSSGFKGVYYNGNSSKNKPWEARFYKNGKTFNIGVFSSAEEAAKAHDLAVIKELGSLGVTNKELGLFDENKKEIEKLERLSSNKLKEKQLGMSLGKAQYQLKKNILFGLIEIAKCNLCYRCNRLIIEAKNLSIDHKSNWLNSKSPKEKFFDTENISFSHLNCNISSMYFNKAKYNSKSGFKGVRSTSNGVLWKSEIWFNNKTTYIGTFTTAKEAAFAYDEKCKILFGDKAITNKKLGLL